MRRWISFVAVPLLLIVLPSCDDATPAQPNQPPAPAPLGPAQLSFAVQFTQATAAASNGKTSVQNRMAQGNIIVTNPSGVSTGTFTGYTLSLRYGGAGGTEVFNEPITFPTGVPVPAGQQMTVPFSHPWQLLDDTYFRPGMDLQLYGGWTMGWDNGFDAGMTSNVETDAAGALSRYAAPGCVEDPFTLCLHGDRFQVRAEWTDAQGTTGQAMVLQRFPPLGGHFGTPSNNPFLALAVDIINFCETNGNFALFATLPNVGEAFTIHATDTMTNTANVYPDLRFVLNPVVDDLLAFPDCGPNLVPVPED